MVLGIILVVFILSFDQLFCTIETSDGDLYYDDDYYVDESSPSDAEIQTYFKKTSRNLTVVPLIDDNFVNMTRDVFSCRPNIEKMLKRGIELAEKMEKEKLLQEELERNDSDKSPSHKIELLIRKRNAMTMKLKQDMTQQFEKSTIVVDEIPEQLDFISTCSAESSDDTGCVEEEGPHLPKVNDTDSSIHNATVRNDTAVPVKKLSYRERLELELRQRQAKRRQLEQRLQTVPLGPDCEELICGVCKTIVQETILVAKASSEKLPALVEDLFPRAQGGGAALCISQRVRSQYTDMVSEICDKYFFNVSECRVWLL